MIGSELTTTQLLERLLAVRSAASSAETCRAEAIASLPDAQRTSAANLVHYLALRNVDLRDEQRGLAARGLSSLGRAEAHILATLDAVLLRLGADVALDERSAMPMLPDDLGRLGPSATQGRSALWAHAAEILGAPDDGRGTRVMVTMPSEAAHDPALVDEFVAAGMNVARINGAHDGPAAWLAMASNIRQAATRHQREVRIAFDLAGPKLRTGPIEPGPAVVRIRPRRDVFGKVLQPARFLLVEQSSTHRFDDLVTVPVTDGFAHGTVPGDRIRFVDARGRTRKATVDTVHDTALEVVGDRTMYLTPGLRLERRRGHEVVATGSVESLPATPSFVALELGETLELRRGTAEGCSARIGEDGSVVAPAQVSVDVPELFSSLAVGDRLLLDDGTIETVVRSIGDQVASVEVIRPERAKLRAEKGINVPDVVLPIEALTEADIAALEVAVTFADMVAFSFVGAPDDVLGLHRHLDRLGADHVGVVLKIEHRTAFRQLPELLLAAMRRPPAAVMVARGDLAVEIGYERLAEVQEEILWLCEAAHVPVIWATQVLESLAKRGAPTRAEVTDAAWSSRAECVMLNKGPFIAETIRFLDDILERMHEHQSKRTPMMRRLSVAAGRPTDD